MTDREAFEQWAHSNFIDTQKVDAEYLYTDSQLLWEAWQAALAYRSEQSSQGQVPEGWQHLMKFYAADTPEQMVAAMERHVERLQAKLPRDNQPMFTRVREG